MKPEGSNNSDKDFSRVENVLLARGHTPDIERMEGGQPARYKKVFETLAKSTYEGIPGVFKIEGKLPGPTLGITVCTHGDEPAGLAAAEYVMTTVANNRDKLSGSIIVVLNNAIETERYFDSKTSDEARHHRLSEVNMNRIPKGALENPNDHRYEIARVRMLLPVYAEFDAGIDIHSTTQEAEPMIIPLGSGLKPNLIKGMPIPAHRLLTISARGKRTYFVSPLKLVHTKMHQRSNAQRNPYKLF
jgi:hypothetical protein